MKTLFGIKMPSIYGFGGILLVLSTKLFPLVFLYVSGALKNVDNSLLEASANMGCKGVKRFFKVVIPLCMPSILAAGLMVFMRSLADFGTPLMIGEGYRTFPVEIYKQYVGEAGTNYNFAAAISVVAVVITAVIFLIQKYASNRFSFTMNALHPIERKKPKRVTGILMHLYCYGMVALSIMPQVYLIYCSFRNTSKTGNMFKEGYSFMNYQQVFETMGDAIFNTIRICGGALIIIVIMAILQQIPMTVEEASASLGSSKFQTFYKVTVPMMFNGVISGAIMSWVTLITELSSSIILYSSKTITLNLGVYIMVQRGTDGKACAVSTILTLFTMLSLLLFMRVSKDKEIAL